MAKRDSVITSSWQAKFFLFALCLVVATLPFNSFPLVKLTNSYSIVALALAWACEGQWHEKSELFRKRKFIYPFIIFYVLFVMGLLYTTNTKAGNFELEKKCYLLVLPVILGTSVTLDQYYRALILKIFVGATFVASVVCLAFAFFRYSNGSDSEVFYYLELTSPILFHPPYFGMFVAGSIMILVEMLLRKSLSLSARMICWFLILYLFTFIILLSARTATIYLLLVVLTAGLYYFYNQKKLVLGLGIMAVMAAVGVVIVFQSASLKDRIIKPLTSDISAIDGGKETGLSIRIVEWKCSLEGFLESPLTGVGPGDGIDYLVSCYEKENFWGMYPQYRYNSHNEYFQLALTLGLPGVIFFLACLWIPLRTIWRARDFLALGFITLFVFCALTESVLERQWGVVFFAFFLPFFYCLPEPSGGRKVDVII